MINALTAKNIRNLDLPTIKFGPSTNIILGENGQGKTNLLEAIFFLAYGKSFMADKSKVIRWGEDEGSIIGQTDEATIQVFIRRSRENKITINSKQKSLSYILGKFLCVSFHPKDIELITGSPGLRRSWLDRLISTMDRGYLVNLVEYNKSILNRNKLLRHLGSDDQLGVWNNITAKLGLKLWRKRQEILTRVNVVLRKEATRITGKNVFLDYIIPINIERLGSEERYRRKLEDLKSTDIKFSATTFGPHRDDFKIIFEEKKHQKIVQKEVSFYGSRAEQRQAVLLLKLVEMRLLTDEFEKYPTLLLDDIASELDKTNKEFLTKPFAKQLIITTTSLEVLPKELVNKAQVFHMKEGKLQSLGASSV